MTEKASKFPAQRAWSQAASRAEGRRTVPPLLSLRAENCSKRVRAMRVKHDELKFKVEPCL